MSSNQSNPAKSLSNHSISTTKPSVEKFRKDEGSLKLSAHWNRVLRREHCGKDRARPGWLTYRGGTLLEIIGDYQSAKRLDLKQHAPAFLEALMEFYEKLGYRTALGVVIIPIKTKRIYVKKSEPQYWTARDCDACRKHTPREQFASDGHGGLRDICKACAAAQKKARYAARKKIKTQPKIAA